MAERLTDKDYFAWHYRCGYQNKKDSLERTQKEHKLGKLEDILEEFNISSIDELHEYLCWEQEQRKELDKIYKVWEKYGCKTLQDVDDLLQDGCDAMCILKENSRLETDRDTWKKACELALKEDYPNRNIPKEDWEEHLEIELKYFYQQAKNEKENK